MPVHALTASELVRMLRRALPGELVLEPADPGYAAATKPHNSSFGQRPAAVLQPRTPEQAAAVVAVARQAGRRVVVQATGHGSGAALDEEVLLLDTSRLDRVVVDPPHAPRGWGPAPPGRGSSRRWSPTACSPSAAPHPPSASPATPSPVESAALVRPYGLAAGSLGPSSTSTARGSATPRGGGGRRLGRPRGPVGLPRRRRRRARHRPQDRRTSPRRPLSGIPALARRRPAAAGPGVDRRCCDSAPNTLTSTLSTAARTASRPFPEELLGQATVHLSNATTGGEQDLTAMREAARAAAPPVIDATGPARRHDPGHDPPRPAQRCAGSRRRLVAGARAADLVVSAVRRRRTGLARPNRALLPGGQPDAGTAFDGAELARLTAGEALDPDRVLGFQRGLPRSTTRHLTTTRPSNIQE